ncbi:MAG: Gfo/Idh/MocA family oxidoreductase [Anaerolineae bacterium]|nr:Gfo/Idh/MocA family oxidoreductase [Anaerolineae bacterium]
MTRIGILSFAHVHAPAYADCLRRLPEVELAGIADEDAERGREAASQYGVEFYPEYEPLLAAGLDGAIITSENVKHLPLARLAAQAGVHVLCEKPIATTMADGREMIRLCHEAGVKLMIAFPCRYSPAVQAVKRALDQRQLGDIYGLKSTNRGQMPGGWFTDRELAGGGAVIDHTVHVMDLVNWFWGSPVRRVYAEIGHDLLWDEGVDDSGLISFRLENGIFGTLDASWSRPEVYPTWGDVTMEIVGERGWLQLHMTAQEVCLYSDALDGVSWVPWGSDTNLALIRDFADTVAADRSPCVTGEDGLRALEVALAAYRAGETGAAVDLPLE